MRRTFIKQIGAVTLLIAGSRALPGFAQAVPEMNDGPEFEPWRTWRTDAQEGSLALVHAAILNRPLCSTWAIPPDLQRRVPEGTFVTYSFDWWQCGIPDR